jgi:hypothetical protein
MADEKHPYCRGRYEDSPQGIIYVCGYNTLIQCRECRYRQPTGLGWLSVRKNPEAKGNRINEGKGEQLTLFPREPYEHEQHQDPERR